MLTMFPTHTNFDIDVLTISFLWFDETKETKSEKVTHLKMPAITLQNLFNSMLIAII